MENNAWGKAVVETALLYAEHEWYPTDKNVMHGVDCSGLLTVCWGLPEKIAARDILNIANVIDIREIKQGDVLAIRSHVMFFKEYIDAENSQVRIIDSTRRTGKVSQREYLVSDLLEQGYLVYRKRQ